MRPPSFTSSSVNSLFQGLQRVHSHRPIRVYCNVCWVCADHVEPGAEYEVFNAASELPFVVDVNLLFGDHDLILKIEAENMGLIAQLVVENIRSIEGVLNTKTLACAEL